MKGAILHVRILSAVALGLGLLMAVLNLYPSWSQTAGTIYDPLLYTTLFSISSLFMITGYTIKVRKKEITKILGVSIDLGKCFRLVAYMFGGVIAFSVNSEFYLVEYLHLLFTGLGILFGYLGLTTWAESKEEKLWATIGLIFGLGGFVLGFTFDLYSTSWAEVLAALPLAIFVNYLWNKD